MSSFDNAKLDEETLRLVNIKSPFQTGIVLVPELFRAVVRIGDDFSTLNVYMAGAKTTDRTRIANRRECAYRCR